MEADERREIEERLPALLRLFYARVREDPELGPVFAAVTDWPQHLEQLDAFWSSVMLTSGRYKGDPIHAHLRHRDKLKPELWSVWLDHWRTVTFEVMSPAVASAMQQKAGRIAQSLSLAMEHAGDRRPAATRRTQVYLHEPGADKA